MNVALSASVTAGAKYWIALWYADAHIDIAANNSGAAGVEVAASAAYSGSFVRHDFTNTK